MIGSGITNFSGRCAARLAPSAGTAAFEEFCFRVIDVVADLVPAVKPQAAFFEEAGPAGCAALGRRDVGVGCRATPAARIHPEFGVAGG